jgi:hypothetical protein
MRKTTIFMCLLNVAGLVFGDIFGMQCEVPANFEVVCHPDMFCCVYENQCDKYASEERLVIFPSADAAFFLLPKTLYQMIIACREDNEFYVPLFDESCWTVGYVLGGEAIIASAPEYACHAYMTKSETITYAKEINKEAFSLCCEACLVPRCSTAINGYFRITEMLFGQVLNALLTKVSHKLEITQWSRTADEALEIVHHAIILET